MCLCTPAYKFAVTLDEDREQMDFSPDKSVMENICQCKTQKRFCRNQPGFSIVTADLQLSNPNTSHFFRAGLRYPLCSLTSELGQGLVTLGAAPAPSQLCTILLISQELPLYLHIRCKVNLQTVLKQGRVGVSEGTLYSR